MEFRKHFGYDVEAASDAAVVDPETFGPSLTVQSMSEDADINVMMLRMGVTGKLPDNPQVPVYADFSEITDFHSALAAVADAADKFNAFPASVRARFDNDPQRMLEFVADSKNLDEAIGLGLMSEAAVEARKRAKMAEAESRRSEIVAAAKAAGLVLKEPAPGST